MSDARNGRQASGRPSGANLPAALRWGHVGVLAFWIALATVLYAGFSLYLKPRSATINAEGELVIPRHRDGHYYVDGEVNGKAIRFLVDTGASRVAVSESFAQAAGLPMGQPITLHTANGAITGRLVPDVSVSAGKFRVSSTSVTVGLIGMQQDQGLLGQSFLSEFDLRITGKQLVLRGRAREQSHPSDVHAPAAVLG